MDKIGLHVIGGFSGSLGRPRVVKLVDVSAEYVRQVRAATGPETLIVVRWVQPSQPVGQPDLSARDWYSRYRGEMRAMTAQGQAPNLAFEGFNEIADGQAQLYARHECERLHLMHGAGLRAVVGNFSVGTPGLATWAIYGPLLSNMGPGDLLGLHEYWTDTADIGNRDHCARWTQVPALAQVPIVVTECGRDRVGSQGAPGWKKSCNAETFLGDLRQYHALIEPFANVIGATVFTAGGHGWGNYDPAPVWPQVVSEYRAEVSMPEAKGERGEWIGSPNFGYPRGTPGRGGRKPVAIVYHVVGGTLAGMDAWAQNPQSQVSYHYCIGKAGQVHQYVLENNAAWHAGGIHRPTWPLLLEGVNPNLYTIGISMEGYSGEPVTEPAYQALLGVTRGVLAWWQITPSAETLIGHCQIDSVNRANCPGPTFPFQRLLRDLRRLPVDERIVRCHAYNAGGVPYNPDAAFPRYARERGLGAPWTPEFDFVEQGVHYRGQGFVSAIVFAVVGDWQHIYEVTW